jgi:hypothetical protein
MSQCYDKNDTPGPQTTVHGLVTDYNTSQPLAGVKLLISERYSTGLFSPNNYRDYDTIITKTDGTYSYTFTPLGNGDFNLFLFAPPNYYNYPYYSDTVKLGKDNKFDLSLSKQINVGIHLKNNSAQNKVYGVTYITTCCNPYIYDGFNMTPKKLDTLVHFKLVRAIQYTVQCQYFDSSKDLNIIYLTQTFKLGLNDTTITIINP